MDRRERMRYFENFDYPTFINNPKVAAFIGKDYDYFKALWAKDIEKKKGDAQKIGNMFHWSWLAVLLTPIAWYGYRKMYIAAWSLIGLYTVLAFIDSYYSFDFGSGVYGGPLLGIALTVKSAYFMNVVGFFQKNEYLSGTALDEKIARKGGTSLLSMIAILLAFILFMVGAALLGDIASGKPVSFSFITTHTTIQSTQ